MAKTITDLLDDSIILVTYIPRLKNGITDKSHPLYGGLSSRATIGISAPLRDNRLQEIFTSEEIKILSEDIGEDLSYKSDFWRELRKDSFGMSIGHFPIYIGKDGLMIKNDSAINYIKIKILKHCNVIANNQQEAKERATEVRFLMINKKDQHKEEINTISAKRTANTLFGKIEDKQAVLVYFLRAINRGVDESHSIEFLQTEVYKEMERNPGLFNSIIQDKFLETKIKLYEYVRYGLVQKNKDLYFDLDGAKLALDGHQNDLTGAAEYLDSGIGSEAKQALDAKLKQAKK